MYRILVIFLISTFFSTVSEAKHIIGGVMYYEFVRNQNNTNTYRIILKMYRDCIPEANKANFDGLVGETKAIATVFQGNNAAFLRRLDFGSPEVRRLSLDGSNKCLILPPDICVEEGVYTVLIDLPVSNTSYHISYQRCCRNNSITNLANPGESGATFTVEITSLAQTLQNSSPQFTNFPPIAICANYPLAFDHVAIDKDGDQLVYNLCAPFLGGGSDDMTNNGCGAVAPDPDCPPPYDQVTYRLPYSATNPLGGNPTLSINSTTGYLAGTPTTIGQFVVGICVSEYRGGQLLSVVRRDFQFNVSSCTKTVDGLLEALGVVGKDIDLKVCGDSIVDIFNQDSDNSNIFSQEWKFVHEGKVQSGIDDHFKLNTKEFGLYEGTLILNAGLPCSDTSSISINVFPDIRADFTTAYDTCLGKEIVFTNNSESDAGPIITSVWKANEDIFSTTFNSKFDVLEPDFYEMKLVVSDQNQCMDSLTKNVPFFPIPQDELVDPGNKVGCDPYTITFEKPNSYITRDYDIRWTFGDGTTGEGLTPSHVYDEVGVFNIGVSVKNVFGCETGELFEQSITVLQSPEAGFTYEPSKPSNLNPIITISDESQFASSWRYDFGNNDFSTVQNPNYSYPDTGVYTITQIVSHDNGCGDTLKLIIDVEPLYTLYLPNAFIVNNTGVNGSYGAVGIPFGIKEYEMSIYDRWGNRVFETNEFKGQWDGKNKNGNALPKGSYVVRVDLTEPRGKKKTLFGSALLIE